MAAGALARGQARRDTERFRHFRPPAILSRHLQGTAKLAVDATLAVTDIVEAMHANIARTPGSRAPAPTRTRGLTAFVYRSIRRVTGWVGFGLDQAATQLQPLVDRVASTSTGPAREALVAALNGLVGDHLAASGNPLATPMQLRGADGEPSTAVGGRTLLLIHGLCMHDGQWLRHGHDHGAALASDLGYRPVYLRYNSGLHVSANGRALARALEDWIDGADAPVTELAIIGYSLGGLVARSACHAAKEAGMRWPRLLRHLVFLGTPHHGAPLERGGHGIDLALTLSRYSAPLAALGHLRSAGITDLRYGSLLDDGHQDDRFGRDARPPRHIPLPRSVTCSAIAASKGRGARDIADRLLGDGLVPVASALGRHAERARTLKFASDRQWVGYGISHLDLLDNAEVYATLRHMLATPPTRRPRAR
ncbi:MAG TPA: hypothetical protein VGC55_12050 [Dokdonella sp.]